jgi:hypothetical protein
MMRILVYGKVSIQEDDQRLVDVCTRRMDEIGIKVGITLTKKNLDNWEPNRIVPL